MKRPPAIVTFLIPTLLNLGLFAVAYYFTFCAWCNDQPITFVYVR